jgi:hypothetical protein
MKPNIVFNEEKRHYIYIIREREFIRFNEPTYKIGRTSQSPDERFSGYPKGSEIVHYTMVEDSQAAEKQLISIFKKTFEHKKEYGNEYFKGDINEMLRIIYSTIYNSKENTKVKEIEEQNKILELKVKETENILNTLKANILALVSPPQEVKTEVREDVEMIEQELIERLRGFYVYSQCQDKIAFVEDVFEKIKECGYKTSQTKILKALSTLGKVSMKKIGDKSVRVVGIE